MVTRQLSSLVAERGRGLGMRPRRASRMVRAWSKSTGLARLCSPSFPLAAGGWSPMGAAGKSVQPTGISERLPSGSTTSTNGTPCRRTVRRRGTVCPRAPVTGAGSGRDCRTAYTTGNRRSKARRFALDSLLEGEGFEPSVPREISDAFESAR
jgi:hypothetical protein